MAKIELIEGTDTGSITISPDELLDIRKHALHCAVLLYAQQGRSYEDTAIRVAKMFENYLTRNVGNG